MNYGFPGGFLYLYNLFTGASEIAFRDATRSTHSFATLVLNMFSDAKADGLMTSILNALARNPWACRFMPMWRDTRPYFWIPNISYGWSSAPDGMGFNSNDPLSRLLWEAHNTLVQLQLKRVLLPQEPKIPPHGFVSPVKLRDGVDPFQLQVRIIAGLGDSINPIQRAGVTFNDVDHDCCSSFVSYSSASSQFVGGVGRVRTEASRQRL